jgi:auxin efflux carrier family protein
MLVKLRRCSELFQLMQYALSSQILGFVVGAIPWLKSFIIGENAPLHVIQETLQLLG